MKVIDSKMINSSLFSLYKYKVSKSIQFTTCREEKNLGTVSVQDKRGSLILTLLKIPQYPSTVAFNG